MIVSLYNTTSPFQETHRKRIHRLGRIRRGREAAHDPGAQNSDNHCLKCFAFSWPTMMVLSISFTVRLIRSFTLS